MITKKALKQINLLSTKKARKTQQSFVVEGRKSVEEFVNHGFEQRGIYAVSPTSFEGAVLVTENEMQKMSFLKNASPVLGVFALPENKIIPEKGRVLVLDQVADPGNLGTILRICDWFEIKCLVCSLDTVDCYNPKVVQASMGSLARVECHYTDLADFLVKDKRPIYGAFLEGKSIYESNLSEHAILVMGSEANGISEKIASCIDQKITIPKANQNGPESLNVAIATALILGEISR